MNEICWQLIDDARRKGREDDAAVSTALIQNLGLLDHDGLDAFQDFLLKQIEALETPAVREHACKFWSLNEANWLHLRTWIVSRGFLMCREARRLPKHMMPAINYQYPDTLKPPSGEIFLHCVAKARERLRNGADMRN